MGATVVFVVDASGSMGASKRMKETKEAILSMLYDSYQKRDKVGMVAFRRQQAEILLDVTSSVNLAQKKLQQLPTGGRTPLASGLFQAWQMLKGRRYKDPEMLPILVLVT
ncbi:MAG: VWA domain-containing protein [Clostridia bacterium]